MDDRDCLAFYPFVIVRIAGAVPPEFFSMPGNRRNGRANALTKLPKS
jgi:hypothetical protein